MRKLVYAFYNPKFSFKKLIDKYPDAAGVITDCLSGDVNKDFSQLWTMDLRICAAAGRPARRRAAVQCRDAVDFPRLKRNVTRHEHDGRAHWRNPGRRKPARAAGLQRAGWFYAAGLLRR